jgi:hypothetical protein
VRSAGISWVSMGASAVTGSVETVTGVVAEDTPEEVDSTGPWESPRESGCVPLRAEDCWSSSACARCKSAPDRHVEAEGRVPGAPASCCGRGYGVEVWERSGRAECRRRDRLRGRSTGALSEDVPWGPGGDGPSATGCEELSVVRGVGTGGPEDVALL